MARTVRDDRSAMAKMSEQLAALTSMTAKQLAGQYRALYGEPTRSHNKDYLRKRLAFRIQELALGGLPPAALERICDLGHAIPERWRIRRARLMAQKATASVAAPSLTVVSSTSEVSMAPASPPPALPMPPATLTAGPPMPTRMLSSAQPVSTMVLPSMPPVPTEMLSSAPPASTPVLSTATQPRSTKVLSTTRRPMPTRALSSAAPMPIGTVIRRTWRHQTFEVIVRADHYEYDGQRYSSLSAVAKVITGAHWNGLAFFGIKRRARVDDGAEPLGDEARR